MTSLDPRGPDPFESHYAELDQATVHYVDEGDGPPLLMLHGNPTRSFYTATSSLGSETASAAQHRITRAKTPYYRRGPVRSPAYRALAARLGILHSWVRARARG